MVPNLRPLRILLKNHRVTKEKGMWEGPWEGDGGGDGDRYTVHTNEVASNKINVKNLSLKN